MVWARRDERGVGFVEAAFGIENGQILAFTLAKVNRRHPRRLAAGADLLVAHRKTGPDCTIGRQRVLDIAKGDQDGPVVIDPRRIVASIDDADLPIGRESCRVGVWRYVLIAVDAVSTKKKTN